MGRKVQVIVEDNKSEPQEAVTVYRKMICSDRVDIFLSGCVSAGNFAAAQFVVRAQIPMVLCSILPPQPDQVKWAYSLLPPPRFEVEKRYEYLKNSTHIRKAGVLHDPAPYANLQKDIAVKDAPGYGIEISGGRAVQAGRRRFQSSDQQNERGRREGAAQDRPWGPDAHGAKNIKQLGLDMLLLGSVDDLAVFKPAAEVLGEQFMFVAAPRRSMTPYPRARSSRRSAASCRCGAPSKASATPAGPAKAGTP